MQDNVNSVLIDEGQAAFWYTILDRVRNVVNEGSYRTWIEPIHFLEVRGRKLHLQVANDFVCNWVKTHFAPAILRAAQQLDEEISDIQWHLHSGRSVSEHITQSLDHASTSGGEAKSSAAKDHTQKDHTQKNDSEINHSQKDFESSHHPVQAKAGQVIAASRATLRKKGINSETQRLAQLNSFYSRYSFENFVEGDCNRSAYHAARTIAEAPATSNFNPLVLYGGTGLGKTHLLQAIGRYAVQNHTADKVVYRTANQFLSEFVNYVHRQKNAASFYKVYNDTDILLIDDIQFIAGKKSSQEELYKVVNALMSQKKQVVITCDQPPSQIKGLHARLLNRFTSGVSLDVQKPDLNTRIHIIRKKIESDGVDAELSREVIRFVASRCGSNVRELEGMLVKLQAFSSLMVSNGQMDIDLARQLLGEALQDSGARLSVRRIMDEVALEFGVRADLLSARSRVQTLALPRKVAIYLSRELTDNSFHSIGLHFHRDYSTVMTACKSLNRQLAQNAELKKQVDTIKNRLI